MKFVMNNSGSPLSFKGSDKVFDNRTATCIEDEEYDALMANSSLFANGVEEGILIVSDEMRMDWLSAPEQINVLSRKNNELAIKKNSLEKENVKLKAEKSKLEKELEELKVLAKKLEEEIKAVEEKKAKKKESK